MHDLFIDSIRALELCDTRACFAIYAGMARQRPARSLIRVIAAEPIC
jgi:hypothetical protein